VQRGNPVLALLLARTRSKTAVTAASTPPVFIHRPVVFLAKITNLLPQQLNKDACLKSSGNVVCPVTKPTSRGQPPIRCQIYGKFSAQGELILIWQVSYFTHTQSRIKILTIINESLSSTNDARAAVIFLSLLF